MFQKFLTANSTFRMFEFSDILKGIKSKLFTYKIFSEFSLDDQGSFVFLHAIAFLIGIASIIRILRIKQHIQARYEYHFRSKISMNYISICFLLTFVHAFATITNSLSEYNFVPLVTTAGFYSIYAIVILGCSTIISFNPSFFSVFLAMISTFIMSITNIYIIDPSFAAFYGLASLAIILSFAVSTICLSTDSVYDALIYEEDIECEDEISYQSKETISTQLK